MISSINFLTFGLGIVLGTGTGLFDFTLGFGIGFGRFFRGLGIGLEIAFVGFIGSGNNLTISDFNLFPLRENLIFLSCTGSSNNVLLNDLLTNLLFFSIHIYIYILLIDFFSLSYKN